MSLLDLVRTAAHQGLTTKAGDGLAPLRLSKDVLRRVNVLLGQPVCSAETLAARREATAKLHDLRSARARGAAAAPREKERAQAPVTIYFEKERNARELGRIEELFSTKGIKATRLDVAGDEATLRFVLRTANVEADQLPVVFVGDRPIGTYRMVVDADVSGALTRALFP